MDRRFSNNSSTAAHVAAPTKVQAIIMRKASDRALIIAIQWKLRGAIGGMSQRFVQYAAHAYDRGVNVQCLTSWSLASHLGLTGHPALICIDDRKFRVRNVALALLVAGLKILARSYTSVHFAGGGRAGEGLFFFAARSGADVSCTFASRTLDMASYGRPEGRKRWLRLLDAADKVDVLNPGHDLFPWAGKISVSACSFPSRLVGKEIQLREKSPLLVFSGALVPSKNPLLALSIIEKILASGRQARLLIFGGGALRAECEVIAESINRAHGDGAVVFGAPELYFDALSEASLFLSLQDHDNYPSQSLMEAMAYGCRCVCTSDGDTRLMFPVGSDDHALLDSRDPKEFADACLRFIDRREPSTVNSEHIFSNHSISAFSRYFDEFMGLAVASRREAKPSY